MIDRADLTAAVVSHIDRHHPRFGQRLMKLRWGGVRTFEPSRGFWATVVATGLSAGLGAREAVRRLSSSRVTPSVAAVTVAGPVAMWMAVWRWDTRRWRRRHVTMVLDLTEDRLEELLAAMDAAGLSADRWEAPRSVGGPAVGLSCRARDLRRVNAIVDAFESGSAPVEPQP